PCEYGRIEILPALVQYSDHRLVGNMRLDRSGLFGHPRCGVARAAFRNFMDSELAKPELAADLVEPLEIAIGKLPFAALLQPAHRNDRNTHAVLAPRFHPARITRAHDASMRVSRFEIGSSAPRSPSPPQGPACTISRDCRTHGPRV